MAIIFSRDNKAYRQLRWGENQTSNMEKLFGLLLIVLGTVVFFWGDKF